MKTTTDTPRTTQDLAAELKTLVAEAEALMNGSPTEDTTDMLDNLRERFSAVQDRLTRTCENARKKVVAGARYTDEAIRANPYQSLAIAVGVGLLVGVLIGRNNK